ncbi:MAG: CDGSH iron-sulfur domain-containing protein [Haloglomus sp.]
MPREVDHDATGPYALTSEDIDPEKGDIAVCRCGLSPEFPFCDGTHRVTEGEDPDTVYRYPDGPDGDRRVVEAVRTADATASGDDGSAPPPGEHPGDSDASSTCGSRLITHEARRPVFIDPEDLEAAGGRIEICLCGLSADGARCDDSHAACADERPSARYRYEGDDADDRRVVTEIEFADGGAEARDGDAED